MNRSLRTLAALTISAGALATGAGGARANTLDVVIAGDSYASGVGGGGTISGGICIRSSNTWGQVYARLARAKGLTVNVSNVACAGGTVPDLDAQMSAVTPDTDLVLLTIGGNDVGFTNIVVQCFAPVIADPARCKSSVDAGKRKVPGVQIAALKRLQTLKAKMRPGGKVVVASYPYLANSSNYILSGLFNSYNSGKGVRELGDLGDQVVINSAAIANAEAGYDLVSLIPVKARFVGHEPNQDPYVDNPSRWVNEIVSDGPYHPNATGYRVMGEQTFAAAGPTFDFGVSQ